MAKQNEPVSATIHLIGLLLSIAALILLVVFAAIYSTAWHVVGFSIFGTSLILLYLASTLYHFFHVTSKAKEILKKIDHAMIHILIAGTYTPICLVAIRGAWGWSLFGVIWGLAIIGILLKILINIKPWVSATIYLFMGWIIIIAFVPLKKSIPSEGLWWLFAGGIFYTIGVLFLGLDRIFPRTRWFGMHETRWFGMHEIFHIFVLAGSFSHFWLMLKYILYI